MIVPILKGPHPLLSATAKPVTKVDKTIKNIIMDMTETLLSVKDPEGVGLAAPQVGKSLQLFIAKPSKKTKRKVFINPVRISPQETLKKRQKKHDEQGNERLEGCLSLPNIWGEVERDPEITISYTNEKGEKRQETFSGFLAIIIQHEMDHLHGILFPKRVLEQSGQLYKSYKDQQGKDVFEEIDL